MHKASLPRLVTFVMGVSPRNASKLSGAKAGPGAGAGSSIAWSRCRDGGGLAVAVVVVAAAVSSRIAVGSRFCARDKVAGATGSQVSD